jgi:hypothetical protein
MQSVKSGSKPRRAKVAHYAFPGGYPIACYVDSDDGEFNACVSCVNQNRVGKNADIQEHINWEDQNMCCEVCEKQIESAY